MSPKSQLTELTEQIEQYRKEAEEAKKELNFEFAFLLMDQADKMEQHNESEWMQRKAEAEDGSFVSVAGSLYKPDTRMKKKSA
jgi:hypothetical protein